MSMVIGTNLPKLKKGYPTTEDNYNVRNAVLNAATATVHAGDIIEFVGDGTFKKSTSSTTVANVAGVCLASLTKVVNGFVSKEASWGANDVIDLVNGGYVAIPVDETVDLTDIVENGQVYFDNGKILASGTNALTGWKFTGVTDTTADGTKLAGIVIEKTY